MSAKIVNLNDYRKVSRKNDKPLPPATPAALGAPKKVIEFPLLRKRRQELAFRRLHVAMAALYSMEA